jgi:hypothetical protein
MNPVFLRPTVLRDEVPGGVEPTDSMPLARGTEHALAREPTTRFHGGSASRDMATQSEQTVALFQEAMMQEGGVYTLAFDIQDPGVPVECVATIRAADKGNYIQRQMNIVKGASISIAGRVFGIYVTDTTPAFLPLSGFESPTPTPGPGTGYVVSVIVERGNRAAESRPPTLYGGSAQIASHASLTVPIPENAGVISLEVTAQVAVAFPSSAPNVTVTFTTASGGIFKQYNPIEYTGFVSAPPGATSVEFVNNDGSNAVNISWTFGIDG